MEISVKISMTFILYFVVFNHVFLIDFTPIAASNTVTNNVPNVVTHRIFIASF